jgi:AraC-like DNA-binding protein
MDSEGVHVSHAFLNGITESTAADIIVTHYRKCCGIEELARMTGRSRTYVRKRLNDAGVPIRHTTPIGRSASIDSGGYARWGSTRVHRIVAEAWYGPPPTPRHHVNHKDGDKLNNHPDNLEWVTPTENYVHAMRIGLVKSLFSDDQVRAIRYLRARGVRVIDVAAAVGLTDNGKISRVANRVSYAHVPDGEVLASACSWCDAPASFLDGLLIENGARLSHGICRSCSEQMMAGLEEAEMEPKPTA